MFFSAMPSIRCETFMFHFLLMCIFIFLERLSNFSSGDLKKNITIALLFTKYTLRSKFEAKVLGKSCSMEYWSTISDKNRDNRKKNSYLRKKLIVKTCFKTVVKCRIFRFITARNCK